MVRAARYLSWDIKFLTWVVFKNLVLRSSTSLKIHFQVILARIESVPIHSRKQMKVSHTRLDSMTLSAPKQIRRKVICYVLLNISRWTATHAHPPCAVALEPW